MNLSLPIHLSIHIFFGFLAGLIVWLIWRKPRAAFFSGFVGGFLIDLDHFIDYYLAFGLKWNWQYFKWGYEFLKSGKIYVLFHAWEYVIILVLLLFLFKNRHARTIILALALGIFFHLVTDVVLDDMPVRSYSLNYRIKNDFAISKIVKEEVYARHLKRKMWVKF